MSSSHIAPAIQEKYAEHSALVTKLGTIDYIPLAYQSNAERIEQLTKEIAKKKDQVRHLEKKTKAEYDDVQELQRSVSKRLFLRVKEGKEGLQKRKIKEENEYLDAFQAEKNEKMAIETLERELELVLQANYTLKERAENFEQCRKRLDELYQELFGGLTKDYPEEDAAEDAVQQIDAEYGKAQEALNRESQVTALLTKAEKAMRKVLRDMDEAEQIGLRDISAAAHMVNFFDMKELKSAKRHAMDVETYVAEARGIEFEVRDLGWLSIPLMDNKTPVQDKDDVHVYKLISDGTKACVRYSTHLENEVQRSKERLQQLGAVVAQRNSDLTQKRGVLDNIRRKIIEDVHQGRLPPPPMPDAQNAWMPKPMSSMPDPSAEFESESFSPAFPSVNTSPTSMFSMPQNYPAGGFRSHAGSVDAIEVSSPTVPSSGVSFPDTPAFSFPVQQQQSTSNTTTSPGGFRGAGDMGPEQSSSTTAWMPAAIPWNLNPYAAWTLWNAAGSQGSTVDAAESGDNCAMPHPGAVQPEELALPGSPAGVEWPEIEDGRVEPPISAEPEDGTLALFKTRARLFQLIPASSTWETVATSCEIRLVDDQKKGQAEMVADATPGPQPVLKTYILNDGMTLRPGVGERSWVLRMSEGECVAVRFGSPAAGKEFKDVFEKAKASYSYSSQELPSGMAMPSGPGDKEPSLLSSDSDRVAAVPGADLKQTGSGR